MKNENNTSVKKYIALVATAVFAVGVLCACGGSGEEAASDATEAAKATVTAEEAAEKAAQDKNDQNMQETTKHVKTGTEDGAIDAAQAAAYEDIEGYDGKWQNLSIDADDPITTIEFDWNGNHYKYEYDQAAGKILK
ncbi:MAG: hypothetical protein Q4D33_13000 [Prevotellaceae bacterium]|nr:hypothetical protein [Prevotellaceae bacterium]